MTRRLFPFRVLARGLSPFLKASLLAKLSALSRRRDVSQTGTPTPQLPHRDLLTTRSGRCWILQTVIHIISECHC
ncbi:hypothetical protein L2E82_28483 [Cichorium intybus]|uniref:Uncharacterized protein n=1 Tax=Cichorium intybus TaxID=13427 RepID=A0ACB9CW29_CICIN|nr:hypothetical protein L2E82_28483 [Cichorium intybus]